MNAENELFKVLLAQNIPDAGVLAGLYRKEVVNRAMQKRGFVEYEYAWARRMSPHALARAHHLFRVLPANWEAP